MPALLLNLVGPQSWGIPSYFKQRDTAAEPTQSGVFGLIEAAMGLDRSEIYPNLNTLWFGVRVDRSGHLAVDYQTAQGVAMADGRGHKNEVIRKYYLADAHFMVAIEGKPQILEAIQQALLAPQRPIYLGRRAFSPIAPLVLPDSLQPKSLETVLATYPWCASHLFQWKFRRNETLLRVVIDDPDGYEVRHDRRVGPPSAHEFTERRVRTYQVAPVLAEPIFLEHTSPAPKQDEIVSPAESDSTPSRRKSSQIVDLTTSSTPAKLFETQLIFANPLFDPLHMHEVHNLLLDALRIGQTKAKVPVLFRLDALAEEQYKLVIRSSRRPDWSRWQLFELIEQQVTPFQPPSISPDDHFRFNVRVNPTKKRAGKKFGLTEAEKQVDWLHRKARERGGFQVIDITQHIQEPPRRAKRGVLFASATFEGVGQLIDKDRFEECLWRGLAASGLFAGFNMLQVIDDAV